MSDPKGFENLQSLSENCRFPTTKAQSLEDTKRKRVCGLVSL
jgi:hypothetical protein